MILNRINYTPLLRAWWKDPIFTTAVVFALIVHLLVLAIEFAAPTQQDAAVKEIAVTLRPSEQKVEHADFLAQADQQGSGTFREAHRMSSDMPAPMLEQSAGEKAMEELNSQFQAKAAMVASLEAQYLQRQQNFSRQQKIKTVDGIQAKQDISAAYLEKFREKVEFYGNRYYPEQAKQQRMAGEVRLMVILNRNGGIRAIRLIESSGHDLLDEAAKASVRKAAPFTAFDSKMKDISELRIVRTWRFDPAEAEFEVH